jgi:hypothetical protein
MVFAVEHHTVVDLS